MIIGIDLDNTLTEVQEDLNNAAYNYAKKLGKDIKTSENPFEKIKRNRDTYKKFNFSYEELKYFLENIHEEITNNAKPRDGVVETIKRLRKQGHKIYIITARLDEFHNNDAYLLSKNWLDKSNIEYDKLIVNAKEKAPICKKERINIFIDDQINNCLDVSKIGTKAIRISNDKKQYENVVTINNWMEIYNFIKEWSNK